jgi:hypothetical protein
MRGVDLASPSGRKMNGTSEADDKHFVAAALSQINKLRARKARCDSKRIAEALSKQLNIDKRTALNRLRQAMRNGHVYR